MNGKLDQKVYEDEVVKPLRGAHGDLPDDLLTRYAVDVSMDKDQLTARVKEIVALWNTKARARNTLAEVYRKFQRAHEDLLRQRAARLDEPGWWRAYAGRRAKTAADEIARLTDMVRQGYGPVGFVLPGQISKIEKEHPGLRRAEIAKVLDDAGIVTVAPVPLPQRSGLDQSSYRRLRDGLAAADVATIAHLLHPEMAPVRLYPDPAAPGAPTAAFDTRALELRSKYAEREADSPRFRALKEALGILRTAVQHGGDLRQIAVFHILETARESRSAGQPAVFVLQRLVKMGLAESDARLLTASLLATEGSSAPVDGAEEVRRLLGDGQLSAARLCAARLPAGDQEADAARALVARTQTQVDDLLSAARAALAAGDEEESSRRAHAARELAADDPEVVRFAASLPPPPPAGLLAVADGFGVKLSWRPVAGADDEMRYRVVRRIGRPPIEPGDGTTVAEVTATTARDATPPAGRSLRYAVFATSDRRVWSRGTTCATELLPPVAGVTMQTIADVARCSWQVHPEAVRVIVRRRLGTPPQGPADGSAVETTGTSFVDSGIAAGVSHCYAITAVYRGENGAERLAAATFVTTTAQEPTAPVASLRAEPLPGDDESVLRVRIVWRQKPVADVRIRLAREPCPWPFGTTVARADLMSYGKELTGELTVRDGRAALVAEIPSGHAFLTPFSFGDDGALVGQDVDLGLTAPVGAVSYERRDDEVLLSWEWPARANAAEVRWAGDGGTGKRRITRGQRARDGGWARIPAGQGALRVEVRAIEVCPTGDAMSGARVVQVADSERRLSYEIGWKPALPGVGTRRACTVRLMTENSCRGVTVVAIAKPGIVRPIDSADGQEVARWHGDVGAGSVSTGGGAFFEVTVPRKFRKPYWLCCFLTDDGVLADPAIAQMKVD